MIHMGKGNKMGLYTKLYMETNFRWIIFCEKQVLKHTEKKTILCKLGLAKCFLIKA